MSERHLHSVKDKPAKDKLKRLYCEACKAVPDYTIRADIGAMKNLEGRWDKRTGRSVALCGNCLARGVITVVGR